MPLRDRTEVLRLRLLILFDFRIQAVVVPLRAMLYKPARLAPDALQGTIDRAMHVIEMNELSAEVRLGRDCAGDVVEGLPAVPVFHEGLKLSALVFLLLVSGSSCLRALLHIRLDLARECDKLSREFGAVTEATLRVEAFDGVLELLDIFLRRLRTVVGKWMQTLADSRDLRQ